MVPLSLRSSGWNFHKSILSLVLLIVLPRGSYGISDSLWGTFFRNAAFSYFLIGRPRESFFFFFLWYYVSFLFPPLWRPFTLGCIASSSCLIFLTFFSPRRFGPRSLPFLQSPGGTLWLSSSWPFFFFFCAFRFCGGRIVCFLLSWNPSLITLHDLSLTGARLRVSCLSLYTCEEQNFHSLAHWPLASPPHSAVRSHLFITRSS